MTDLQKLEIKINGLIEVIRKYDFLSGLYKELLKTSDKIQKDEITVPIIGEFSSGKSSLLNCLMSDYKLAADALPTTAAIYEVRFSCDKTEIVISNENGESQTVAEPEQFSHIDLSKSNLIKIYSFSSLLPKGIVLVDMPGLSSDISAHEKILLDYIPVADAILFVIDANQGFTKTSLDFIKLINPLDKKILVVLTKTDTKSPSEITSLVNYSINKLGLQRENILSTSAKTKQVAPLVSAIKSLLGLKVEILQANAGRMVDLIAKESITKLYLQLKSSDLSVSDIETKTKQMKAEFELIKLNILEEVQKAKEKLSIAEKSAVKAFSDYTRSEIAGLVDNAFDKSEQLEQCFDDVIKRAADHALLQVYKKEVETITQELSDAVSSIPQKIDVGTLFPVAAIKLLTEALNILILDIVIPGGAADAVFGRLTIKLAERWPSFKSVWDSISEPIREFVEAGVKIVSRKYVSDQIEKALSKAIESFAKELHIYSMDLQNKIEGNIKDKFSENEKSILATLQSLKNEKEDRTKDFSSYVSELKHSISICEKLL